MPVIPVLKEIYEKKLQDFFDELEALVLNTEMDHFRLKNKTKSEFH